MERMQPNNVLLEKLGFNGNLELVTDDHGHVKYHRDNGLVVNYPQFHKEERVYSTFFPLAQDKEGLVHSLLVIGNSIVADDPGLTRSLRNGNMNSHGVSSSGTVIIDPTLLRGHPPLHIMKAPNALLLIPTVQMRGRRR